MNVDFDPDKPTCTVQKEPTDKKLKPSGYGSDIDSSFWYALKNHLKSAGHDVIKRRLSADGHLMGTDTTQYLRHRKGDWCIYDGQWMLRTLLQDFNEGKEIKLEVQK